MKLRIITYQDVSKYVGKIKNNKKNGYGIWNCIDGLVYLAEFKNDKIDAMGDYIILLMIYYMKVNLKIM